MPGVLGEPFFKKLLMIDSKKETDELQQTEQASYFGKSRDQMVRISVVDIYLIEYSKLIANIVIRPILKVLVYV